MQVVERYLDCFMGLGFEAQFEDDKFIGDFDLSGRHIFAKRVNIDDFPDEVLVLLVEVAFHLLLELDQQIDKFGQFGHRLYYPPTTPAPTQYPPSLCMSIES